jgi:hypothetical protein
LPLFPNHGHKARHVRGALRAQPRTDRTIKAAARHAAGRIVPTDCRKLYVQLSNRDFLGDHRFPLRDPLPKLAPRAWGSAVSPDWAGNLSKGSINGCQTLKFPAGFPGLPARNREPWSLIPGPVGTLEASGRPGTCPARSQEADHDQSANPPGFTRRKVDCARIAQIRE